MIAFTVPIKTQNESNGSHGHWAAKASRRRKQREATIVTFIKATAGKRWQIDPPYRVTMRRISAGLLDTDALPLSLKSIRDQIAEELGVTDGPTDSRVTWIYDQRRGKRGAFSVEVEIDCLSNGTTEELK